MRSRVSIPLMCGAFVASIACAPAAEPPPAEEPAQEAATDPCAGMNSLTDAERADGWKLLFDGSSMNAGTGTTEESPRPGRSRTAP